MTTTPTDTHLDWSAQVAQCGYDDAYHKGQQAAWADAPSRFRWLVLGFLAGIAIAVLEALT